MPFKCFRDCTCFCPVLFFAATISWYASHRSCPLTKAKWWYSVLNRSFSYWIWQLTCLVLARCSSNFTFSRNASPFRVRSSLSHFPWQLISTDSSLSCMPCAILLSAIQDRKRSYIWNINTGLPTRHPYMEDTPQNSQIQGENQAYSKIFRSMFDLKWQNVSKLDILLMKNCSENRNTCPQLKKLPKSCRAESVYA